MKVLARYADLAGRRALVTGASSGIGRGVGEDLCVSGGALLVVPRGQIVQRDR